MLHVGIREKPRFVDTLESEFTQFESLQSADQGGRNEVVRATLPTFKGSKDSLMDFELLLPKELDDLGGYPKRQELDRLTTDVSLTAEVRVLMG